MKCHKPSIFKGLWHSYADSCVKDEIISLIFENARKN